MVWLSIDPICAEHCERRYRNRAWPIQPYRRAGRAQRPSSRPFALDMSLTTAQPPLHHYLSAHSSHGGQRQDECLAHERARSNGSSQVNAREQPGVGPSGLGQTGAGGEASGSAPKLAVPFFRCTSGSGSHEGPRLEGETRGREARAELFLCRRVLRPSRLTFCPSSSLV
jgi:hypothetical protein